MIKDLHDKFVEETIQLLDTQNELASVSEAHGEPSDSPEYWGNLPN
jgi:hypothetical protein